MISNGTNHVRKKETISVKRKFEFEASIMYHHSHILIQIKRWISISYLETMPTVYFINGSGKTM
jgi:hypothetical protein